MKKLTNQKFNKSFAVLFILVILTYVLFGSFIIQKISGLNYVKAVSEDPSGLPVPPQECSADAPHEIVPSCTICNTDPNLLRCYGNAFRLCQTDPLIPPPTQTGESSWFAADTFPSGTVLYNGVVFPVPSGGVYVCDANVYGCVCPGKSDQGLVEPKDDPANFYIQEGGNEDIINQVELLLESLYFPPIIPGLPWEPPENGEPTPPPPEGPGAFAGSTLAAVYGRPGGWGTLSKASTADKAIQLAESFAKRVDVWNGDKPTYVVINPVLTAGSSGCHLYFLSNTYVSSLVQKAKAKGYYVMFDVQTAGCNPETKMKQIIDDYLLDDNVFFDLDIEWISSHSISANTINKIADYYFAKRKEKGYTSPGIFGFYIFQFWQVTNPGALHHTYDNGSVIPIFDGYGSCAAKRSSTNRMISLFGKPYGGMEFQTKWGSKYDTCAAQQYFRDFPDMQIFASQ